MYVTVHLLIVTMKCFLAKIKNARTVLWESFIIGTNYYRRCKKMLKTFVDSTQVQVGKMMSGRVART